MIRVVFPCACRYGDVFSLRALLCAVVTRHTHRPRVFLDRAVAFCSTGGAREEVSLEALMEKVKAEATALEGDGKDVDEDEIVGKSAARRTSLRFEYPGGAFFVHRRFVLSVVVAML